MKRSIELWYEQQAVAIRHSSVEQKAESDIHHYKSLLLQKFIAEQGELKAAGVNTDILPPEPERRNQLQRLIKEINVIPSKFHTGIVDMILNDMYRKGIFAPIFRKPGVTDIQAVIPSDKSQPQIIVYRIGGTWYQYKGVGFSSLAEARDWVNTQLSPYGQQFDPAKIYLDGQLPSGERIHVIYGPTGYSKFQRGKQIIVKGMIISIRLHPRAWSLQELTEKSQMMLDIPALPPNMQLRPTNWKRTKKPLYCRLTDGMADPASMDLVSIAFTMRKSAIFAGPTGTGKTTLFNAGTAFIPPSLNKLFIEEKPEGQSQTEWQEESVEGLFHALRLWEEDGLPLQLALKQAMRMAPDLIFIQEVRDWLGKTLLDAIRSGHPGMTTLHGATCDLALQQFIEYCMGHPSGPSRAEVERDTYELIDLVVHVKRVGKKRYVDEICEVNNDGSLHKVMEFVEEGKSDDGNPIGYWVFYGPSDDFVEQMKLENIDPPASWGWEVAAC